MIGCLGQRWLFRNPVKKHSRRWCIPTIVPTNLSNQLVLLHIFRETGVCSLDILFILDIVGICERGRWRQLLLLYKNRSCQVCIVLQREPLQIQRNSRVYLEEKISFESTLIRVLLTLLATS